MKQKVNSPTSKKLDNSDQNISLNQISLTDFSTFEKSILIILSSVIIYVLYFLNSFLFAFLVPYRIDLLFWLLGIDLLIFGYGAYFDTYTYTEIEKREKIEKRRKEIFRGCCYLTFHAGRYYCSCGRVVINQI